MAKPSAEQITEQDGHPYDFHVSGPRNLSSPTWRDLVSSNWKDNNYKRTVMACFIQAAYLMELDRQENKTGEDGLALRWLKPFKYKLGQTLLDERDGSIFGAILEWDRAAALTDFILMRPSGAPRAVLALRGTLLKSHTIRRDLEDDLRFLAWESLKGSVRFYVALEALKSAVERFGSCNVCIAGHSLGAGFAFQVGKTLAKQGVFVETHLFNPPSVSIAMSLRNLGEKAGYVWRRMKSMFPSSVEVLPNNEEEEKGSPSSHGWGLLRAEVKKWVPHLYVNNSDYICCYYTDPAENAEAKQVATVGSKKLLKNDAQKGDVTAKMFVIMSKGPQKFLEAHGLEQWWSSDMELQLAIHDSKLITKQLKSLYSAQGKAQ
ncbi:GDSL esterase/lipase At4g10955-like [Aristolochia californica]|uniref:GDSL esterase/lipase At4g10955-like n=1 Tax=Aristolochia californica TaxID=171875 RepID=UPI0035E3980B